MIWLPAGQPEAEHKESTADFISTPVFKPESVFPQITHFLIYSLPILIPSKRKKNKFTISPTFAPWATKTKEIQ